MKLKQHTLCDHTTGLVDFGPMFGCSIKRFGVAYVAGGSFSKQMTLNFDLDLSKVNGDIWRRCWTSVPNFVKNGLHIFREISRSVTNKVINKHAWSQYLPCSKAISMIRQWIEALFNALFCRPTGSTHCALCVIVGSTAGYSDTWY